MNFRLLLFFVLAFAVTGLAGEPPPAENKLKPVRDPYEVLKTVNEFIIGGVGVAGSTSGEEAAFRQMLKEPEPLARCHKLLAEATPAGQLYGLLGLSLLDPAAFQKALPRYRDSKTTIPSVGGCIRFQTTAGAIASQIEKGQFK